MENTKQVSGRGASSFSSFTLDLFGPKDSSSSAIFGSVFGPPSTGLGLGIDSSHSGITGSMKKQDLGGQHGNAVHGTPGYISRRNKGESVGMDKDSNDQNSTAEPCYFSSSIYYGAQEVYSPKNQTTASQHIFKKDGDDDPNGNNVNSASRGNWWQGSLYY